MQKETEALNTIAVDVKKSGWLSKLSPNDTFGKKHQKRWIVLNGIKFEYFKSDKDKEPSLGVLSLDKCKITTLGEAEALKKYGHEFLIEIAQDNGKSTLLFAQTAEEKKEWVDAMQGNRSKHIARSGRSTALLPPKREAPQAVPTKS